MAAAPAFLLLAVIGIWYGAWVAFAQTDMKKLVAYSSVSHMGIVILGIFSFNGAWPAAPCRWSTTASLRGRSSCWWACCMNGPTAGRSPTSAGYGR